MHDCYYCFDSPLNVACTIVIGPNHTWRLNQYSYDYLLSFPKLFALTDPMNGANGKEGSNSFTWCPDYQ